MGARTARYSGSESLAWPPERLSSASIGAWIAARAGGAGTGAVTMDLRKRNLLCAEEQLVYGRYLSDVVAARNELRQTHPECLLLELVDAKITRMLRAESWLSSAREPAP